MRRIVLGILSMRVSEAPPKAEKGKCVQCSFKVLSGLRAGQETRSIDAWLSSLTLHPEATLWRLGAGPTQDTDTNHTAWLQEGLWVQTAAVPLPCFVSLGKSLNLSVPASATSTELGSVRMRRSEALT